jgi:hypothetical protein
VCGDCSDAVMAVQVARRILKSSWFNSVGGASGAMPKPCSERDRLRGAYYQATLEASASCAALPPAAFGPEFSAALDKAEAAYLGCVAARHAYEEHCVDHGCEPEWYRPLR